MEETKELSSCLMLMANLDTPVDLGSVFLAEDLKDTGIEADSHVTLLYAGNKELPRQNMLSDISTILGNEDFEWLDNLCKSNKEFKVLDLFYLSSFENDSDYVVLKLSKFQKLSRILGLINKGLKIKYGVTSDFDSYVPHMTLAELGQGKAKGYLESETLKLILESSYVSFEDIVLSVAMDKQMSITVNYPAERYFRVLHTRENNKRLEE